MPLTERFLATRPQQAFIGTIILQSLIVLACVAITYQTAVNNNIDLTAQNQKTIPCYLALFAFAEVFEIVMALDALRARNTIQLGGILLFHGAMIVFGGLQIFETHRALESDVFHKIEPFVIAVPGVIALSWLIVFLWVRALYYEFGWAIFHVVGANPAMKTMYQFYQVMVCLLKFDFFCFVGVTMQLLIIVLSENSAEFGITVLAIPIVLILLALAGVAVQKEIKWMMSVALGLMLAAETYFIYKLVRFYEPSSRAQYDSTRVSLTFFTIVAFIILFATFAIGLRCFADFDKGLLYSKTQSQLTASYSTMLKQNGTSQGAAGERQTSYYGGAALQPRISIE